MVQIDFLFFVLLVPYARGTNIYIYGLFFFLSIVEGGLSERVVSGWGGGGRG